MTDRTRQDVLRESVAALVPRARFVRVDETALVAYLDDVARRDAQPRHDPPPAAGSSAEDRIAFVLLRDATNFSSGWHPHLRKLPGLSGARTTGVRLADWLAAEGVPSAEWLTRVTPEDCARVFAQPMTPPVDALMALFAEAWRQLGAALLDDHDGRYGALVAAAEGSAVRLVERLARLGHFHDVYHHDGLTLPFLKRAQLAAYDLAVFCADDPRCRFDDLPRLTIFADNLVPHVLRIDGVLSVDPGLEARIEAGEEIAAGSTEEIELRAMAVHAAERLTALAAERGDAVMPLRLLDWLWNRGQAPRYKARPRQRTRSVHY